MTQKCHPHNHQTFLPVEFLSSEWFLLMVEAPECPPWLLKVDPGRPCSLLEPIWLLAVDPGRPLVADRHIWTWLLLAVEPGLPWLGWVWLEVEEPRRPPWPWSDPGRPPWPLPADPPEPLLRRACNPWSAWCSWCWFNFSCCCCCCCCCCWWWFVNRDMCCCWWAADVVLNKREYKYCTNVEVEVKK